MFNRITLRGLLGAAALTVAAASAQAEIKGLEILAPSNPGSGWDQTARGFQQVAEAIGAASGIQVINVGGGGGTVGLAQFVTSMGGRDDAIMLSGLAMVSGVLINQSAVTLDDVRPLARLIGEYEVIVVPAASEYQNLGQLIEAFKADPMSVSWGAGSAGSADHLLMGILAEATGVPATSVNYIGHSGGGEALAAILGGHVTAGVSGYQEFAAQIESGELRALAISAPAPVEGIAIPTFIEQGVNVDFVNWRGIMVAKDISDEGFAAAAKMVDDVVKSEQWQTLAAERGWLSLYLPAAEFEPFLADNRAQTEATLKAIGLIE
ncbi:tripartite tricarboxylate transporter substrate binding protein [Neotabrizicola sp. sgz301269]|uniref:tripartite tricarboxylate transporter substrate binding protein n=1 Tax=Neotabrizicola sp. sgz301269 TaxID=3276282 RepID=UPI00376FADB1